MKDSSSSEIEVLSTKKRRMSVDSDDGIQMIKKTTKRQKVRTNRTSGEKGNGRARGVAARKGTAGLRDEEGGVVSGGVNGKVESAGVTTRRINNVRITTNRVVGDKTVANKAVGNKDVSNKIAINKAVINKNLENKAAIDKALVSAPPVNTTPTPTKPLTTTPAKPLTTTPATPLTTPTTTTSTITFTLLINTTPHILSLPPSSSLAPLYTTQNGPPLINTKSKKIKFKGNFVSRFCSLGVLGVQNGDVIEVCDTSDTAVSASANANTSANTNTNTITNTDSRARVKINYAVNKSLELEIVQKEATDELLRRVNEITKGNFSFIVMNGERLTSCGFESGDVVDVFK